ncbi:MAG: hypothetical protein SGJ00_12880 [bacterium]|nr:hypothetical protein [bacterium]
MKTLLTILLLNAILIGKLYAQNSSFALHIYNPLGMFQKVGAKFEYRKNKMGFLIMGIQYYGYLPSYPGTQVGLESRYYTNPFNKNENFIYGKVYGGYQQHTNASGDGFLRRAEVPASNYYGFGGGVGRHFNYQHFFIDINTGLKFSLSDVKQDDAFFITGPASYLDLHFNLGFQF